MRPLRWLQAFAALALVVLLGARDASAQQRVLFYGPGGTDAAGFFGAGAATITTASAATWRAMTSDDFGGYDQIWVQGLQCATDARFFDTLIATRAVWGPAVTGRVVFNHADEDHHAFNTTSQPVQAAQAQRLIRNAFGWLRTGRSNEGGATSMYLSTGCLVTLADPSFLSSSLAEVFGPGFTDDFAERDPIRTTALAASHPVAMGLTASPGLQWRFFCHGGIPTFPSGFQSLVTCPAPFAGAPEASGLIVREALAPCPVATGQCAPRSPVIVAPANRSITTNQRPAITGTADPGSTVRVFIDGASVGTTTASASGTFSLTLSVGLSIDTHTVRATASLTGITSLASNTNSFTVLGCLSAADCTTLAPICDPSSRRCRVCSVASEATDCPTAEVPACSTFSPTTGRCVPRPPVLVTPANGSTTPARPRFSGTARPNTFVTVLVDDLVLGSTTSDASGAWSFIPVTPLARGSHTAFARVTAGGLPSGSSNTHTFFVASCSSGADCSGGTPICDPAMLVCRPCSVATMASDCPNVLRPLCSTSGETAGQCVPAAPVIVTPANGSATSSRRPPITGTAAPGSMVTVFVDGAPVGSVTASPAGTFSFTPTVDLSLGTHTASATAAVDGVRSPISEISTFRVVLCTTNAECGASTPACDLPMGVCRPCVVTTMFTDCTSPGRPLCSTLGATAGRCVPRAPTILAPADGSSTANPRPPITGTAAPGSTVTVTIDGVVVGTTTTDPAGNFSFTPPLGLSLGSHMVSATATLGGLSGPPSPTHRFRVDQCAVNADCGVSTPICDVSAGLCRACAVATMSSDCPSGSFPLCSVAGASAGQCVPSAPTVLTPADGSMTANPRPVISGTANPSITVVVYLDGVEIGRTTSDSSGRWSFTPTVDIAVGMHRATAAGINPSGALGPLSAANGFRVFQCIVSSDCAGASVCDTASHTCVGCTSNADCRGSTPVCDSARRVCRPCAVATLATDCADPVRPVCSTAGPFAGQCVPTTPAVLRPVDGSSTADPRPVVSGTASPGSTVIVFIDGVEVGRVMADPMGAWSFTPSVSLGLGSHTASAAISTPAGAGPMSPANMFRVVQCLVNSDCPAMAICVVATNTCGCGSDADCPMSAPICDLTTRVCVARADAGTDASDGATDASDGATDLGDGANDASEISTDASEDLGDSSSDAMDASDEASDGATDGASDEATDGASDDTSNDVLEGAVDSDDAPSSGDSRSPSDGALDSATGDGGSATLSYRGGGCACHSAGAGSSRPRDLGAILAAALCLSAIRRRRRG